MRLVEHLTEFRNRFIVCAIAILITTIIGFALTTPVLDAIRVPVEQLDAGRTGTTAINWTNVTTAFDLRMRMGITLGIVLACPVWLYEIWMFVMPGLKKAERRYVIGFVASAVPLFLAGCVTGWLVLPRIVDVMASFAPTPDAVLFDARAYYEFVLNLCLAVGVAYVIPVFLVMLNLAGVLSGKAILSAWRWAVLGIAVFAAMATPAADVLSMFLLMIPMTVLYFLAVGVALLNDRRRVKREHKRQEQIEEELANR